MTAVRPYQRLYSAEKQITIDLPELLMRGCDRLRDYLKHNLTVEESERL